MFRSERAPRINEIMYAEEDANKTGNVACDKPSVVSSACNATGRKVNMAAVSVSVWPKGKVCRLCARNHFDYDWPN